MLWSPFVWVSVIRVGVCVMWHSFRVFLRFHDVARLVTLVIPICSGGSKGGARDARPPGGPNSFNFMQFLGKFGKIVCWRPPGELAPPPRGNPGSTTDLDA